MRTNIALLPPLKKGVDERSEEGDFLLVNIYNAQVYTAP